MRGHYATSFETSRFVECGSDEPWWVDGPALEAVDGFLRDRRGLAPRTRGDALQDGTVFLTWTGQISPPGEYGHLGDYDRLFTAVALVGIAMPGPDDCSSPEPGVGAEPR